MRAIFDAELQQLGDDLETMSRRVAEAVSGASRALREADLALAEQVIAADAEIDALERALDERCVLLLAQQQPVATDLRVVVSGLRMSASLERMGDLARHIAEIARGRYPASAVPPQLADTFAQIEAATVSAAERVSTLLSTHDLALAEQIEADDDLIDDLHESTFATMLGEPWPGTPQELIDVTLLGRYFERFGDHAVSVTRRVVFLVTGEFESDEPGTIH